MKIRYQLLISTSIAALISISAGDYQIVPIVIIGVVFLLGFHLAKFAIKYIIWPMLKLLAFVTGIFVILSLFGKAFPRN